MTVTYRTASSSDVPALVDLVESAYRGESSRRGWTTEADLLDGQRTDPQMLLTEIDRTDSVVLLAEEDGTLLGCAHVVRTAPGIGYFGMFAVRPDSQGRGLGKEILTAAEDYLHAEWDVRLVEMTVLDARTELLDFYERRGYVRSGEHRSFPYGDERFGAPRVDDLRMEVLRKELAPLRPV